MNSRQDICSGTQGTDFLYGSAVAALAGIEYIAAVNDFLKLLKSHLNLVFVKVLLANLALYKFGSLGHERIYIGLALQLLVLEYCRKEPAAYIFAAHFENFGLYYKEFKVALRLAANFCEFLLGVYNL